MALSLLTKLPLRIPMVMTMLAKKLVRGNTGARRFCIAGEKSETAFCVGSLEYAYIAYLYKKQGGKCNGVGYK